MGEMRVKGNWGRNWPKNKLGGGYKGRRTWDVDGEMVRNSEGVSV